VKISRTVKKILDNYESDCPGTKANLARILMHGRLGGSGKMVILPVDQGFEHGPARSFAPNPDAYDPHYHYQLAIDAGLNAYAAPLGPLEAGADTFAGAIAGALKAKRFLLLTDVPGVLDKSKQLIKQLSVNDARRLIADGTISGGMIPKVETCIYALDQGVEGVVILDGKVEHAVLMELLTDAGAGTLMHR